jgi:pyridoxamine 5'-phosphate oxidase
MPIKPTDNPIDLFSHWFQEAGQDSRIEEPTAMSLATIGKDGIPDVRIVLMKGYDETGFTFYTNLASAKAEQVTEHPTGAVCFHWMPLSKQVRIRGSIETVGDAEADEYFQSRPKESQIGAWASKQSEPLEGRLALEKRVAKYTARYALGKVPRPDFWSGFRLKPKSIEFWLKQPYRLHDRVLYTRKQPDGWEYIRLYP